MTMAKPCKLGGAPRDSYVGFCWLHKRPLTARQLRCRKCLAKGCGALERREHPYWEEREERKAARRARQDERRTFLAGLGGAWK